MLLVKRFDREKTGRGYTRARMISGLTLLGAGGRSIATSGRTCCLAEELRRVSEEPEADAAELFRRMCFNALISNLDDHPRNHAIIAKDREWKLSPAYDLTPSPVVSAGPPRSRDGDWRSGPLCECEKHSIAAHPLPPRTG